MIPSPTLLSLPPTRLAASGPAQVRFLLPMILGLALIAGRAGAQQFTEILPGLPEKAFPCVAVGDYDGDGDLDVLVAAAGSHDIAFTTIYNNSAGTFTASPIALLGLARATAAWGDFDRDGDLDLAMTGLTTAGVPTTVIYRNDGGTFTPLSNNLLGVFAGSVAWGDYDGDGDLDLLVTGVTSTTANGVPATRLYRNDGNGVFTSVAHPFPDCYSGAAAWGDYNHDGRLDLVIMGTGTSALFASVWRNDGNGVFTDIGANIPGLDLGFAAWGDFDNDGDLDLLIGGDPRTAGGAITRVYRNDGGTFVDTNAGLPGLLWASAAWGDYDNDGDLDIMLQGYDAAAAAPRSYLLRNDGGTFVNSGIVLPNLYIGTLCWMDYDNDGDLDLLLAGNNGVGIDVLRIFSNNNATPNAAPAAPTNLAVSASGTAAEFTWSAPTDDHTPSAGLSYNLRVGTTPGGSQVLSAQSGPDGYRRLPALGNAQSGLIARVGGLSPETLYYWSVQAVDASFAGSPFAAEGSFTSAVAGVGDPGRPTITALGAAPNPFAGPTTISYALSAPQSVHLGIYDATGRQVRSLDHGAREAGRYVAKWDGLDESGRALSAGVYFARLQGEKGMANRKLVLLR